MISDLGLINLIGGIICNTANDLRYRSGLVYDFCPVCDNEFENNSSSQICINCGRAVYTYNIAAENFLDSKWFDNIMYPGPMKVKYLIRNRKVTIRKNYE